MDSEDIGKNQRVGDQDNDAIIPSPKAKNETWVDHHTRTCNMAKKIWVQVDLRQIAENMCRAMGFEESAQMETSRWWRSSQTRMVKEDQEHCSRWNHKWRCNRGNVMG